MKNLTKASFVEAEAAIVSACLQSEDYIRLIPRYITEKCFTDQKLRIVYSAIRELHNKNVAVDMITVTNHLISTKQIDEVGGPYEISQIACVALTTVPIEEYCAIIHQLYMARCLAMCGQKIVALANDQTLDVADSMIESLNMLEALNKNIDLEESIKDMFAASASIVSRYAERKKQAELGMPMGVTTGLTPLNTLLSGGWKKNQLIIVGARPGMGKTSIALHFAKSAAYAGNHVAIFSLEMDESALSDRLCLAQSGLNAWSFKMGRLDPHEEQRMKQAAQELSQLPIIIDDTATTSIQQIKNKAKQLMSRGELNLIIIDYLQLVDMQSKNKMYNKVQEVSEASRAAKLMAKELKIPVILLSQLNREAGKTGSEGEPPKLTDLRDSGSIEQDADMVLFIHRQHYYTKKEEHKNKGEIIVAKQRDGMAGVGVPFMHNDNLSQIFEEEQLSTSENPF